MTLLLQPQLQQVSYQALSGYLMNMKKFWFAHYAGAQMVLFYSLFIWKIGIFQFGMVTLMPTCFDQIMLWDNDADDEVNVPAITCPYYLLGNKFTFQGWPAKHLWSSLSVWTVFRSFNNMCGEWMVPISVILLSVIIKLSGWLAARWLWRCSSSPFCSSWRRHKISSQILQQQEQGLTTSICIFLAFNKI